MAINCEIACYLLEGMMNNGLSFVGSYLERKIACPVVITDVIGKIHYPDMSDMAQKSELLFMNIPDQFTQEYYHSSANNCFYYNVQNEDNTIAYVIVENITTDATAQAITAIQQSLLALKSYFSFI
jgi:hypothetical protein